MSLNGLLIIYIHKRENSSFVYSLSHSLLLFPSLSLSFSPPSLSLSLSLSLTVSLTLSLSSSFGLSFCYLKNAFLILTGQQVRQQCSHAFRCRDISSSKKIASAFSNVTKNPLSAVQLDVVRSEGQVLGGSGAMVPEKKPRLPETGFQVYFKLKIC